MPLAVIFDMDGVIIDSEHVHHEIERQMFDRLGISVTPAEHMVFTGMVGNTMWEILAERYKFTMSLGEISYWVRRQFYAEYDAPDSRIRLVEGVADLIDRCAASGYKLAVASSSSSAYVRMNVLRFGLADKFDRLCGGDIVLRGKPEPDLFLFAAEQLGVDPADCVVIEDSANGVLAARRAGMQVIGYTNPNSAGQDLSLADKIVSSLSLINIR